MIIPMILPIVYSLKFKRESIMEIVLISISMVIIVITYWPLTTELILPSNIVVKFILFVFIPIIILYIARKYKQQDGNTTYSFDKFGISTNGIKQSIKLSLILIPVMLLSTFLIKSLITSVSVEPNFSLGLVSFIESFTEEFFFRGILFIFLIKKTSFKVAYITSLASFILMHPQNFTSLFLITTIIQGILTLEICRRTKNIAGAWILHGTNRFFSIFLLPFIL